MATLLNELGIDRLDRHERLQLLGEIWDSLDLLPTDEISEDFREELDHRLDAADADPSAGIPWEIVRERLRGTA